MVGNAATLALLGRLGRRLAYLPTDGDGPADPALVRLGRHLQFLHEYEHMPGQQLVVVLTELMGSNWATGQTGVERQSLSALDAYIDPPDGVHGFEAAAAAERIPVGPLPGGDDDERLEPLVTKLNEAREGGTDPDVVAPFLGTIAAHYAPLLANTWELVWRCFRREAEYPEAASCERRFFEDRREYTNHIEWVVAKGGRRRTRKTARQAVRYLARLEGAQERLLAEEALDDPLRMIPYLLDGKAVRGVVRLIDRDYMEVAKVQRVRQTAGGARLRGTLPDACRQEAVLDRRGGWARLEDSRREQLRQPFAGDHEADDELSARHAAARPGSLLLDPHQLAAVREAPAARGLRGHTGISNAASASDSGGCGRCAVTYDEAAVAAADEVARAALEDFLSCGGSYRAVVLSAVAGAGKSYFVSSAAGAARREGMRIAVCAPTNEQAFSLVRSIALMNTDEVVTFVPASSVELPSEIAALPNVREARPAGEAVSAGLIVGTFDKLGDAFARGSLFPVDGLLADESYQADSGRYFGVAGLAPAHLLVGDSGQIDPFSTVPVADDWRGLDENPLQTAVGVVQRTHPELTSIHRFPITRRLDERAVVVARAFYSPEHHFVPALLPGVRGMRLASGRERRRVRTPCR